MDALLLPAERGACWTLLHPSYPVVVPQPNLVEVPIAYPVARRDQKLAQFMTRWIKLKQGDGTLDALDEYWIKSSFSPRDVVVESKWSTICELCSLV